MNHSEEEIASVPCEQNCLRPRHSGFICVCHAYVMTTARFSCCFYQSVGPSQGCCRLSNAVGTVIYHYVMGDSALHRFGTRCYNLSANLSHFTKTTRRCWAQHAVRRRADVHSSSAMFHALTLRIALNTWRDTLRLITYLLIPRVPHLSFSTSA